MRVTISIDLVNKIVKFLEQLPYQHVHVLLKEIIEDCSGQKPTLETEVKTDDVSNDR